MPLKLDIAAVATTVEAVADFFNQPLLAVDFGLKAGHADGCFGREVGAADSQGKAELGGTAQEATESSAGTSKGCLLAGVEVAQGFDFEAVGVDASGGLDGAGDGAAAVSAPAAGFAGFGFALRLEVVFVDDNLFAAASVFVGVVGADGVVGVGGRVVKAVIVAAGTGNSERRDGRTAGGLCLPGRDKQQAAGFDGGDGIIAFGKARKEAGVALVGLVDMGDGFPLVLLGNAVLIAVLFGYGLDALIERCFVPAALFLLA